MIESEEAQVAEINSKEQEKEGEIKKISKPTEKFLAFLSELDTIPEPENKLRKTLSFMEEALSQENGVPHFKNFWDARDVCLKLFRDGLSHQVREVFWGRYSELSREARRLKDILDEQSAFAVEQIEIAIKALENDIQTISIQITSSEIIALPEGLFDEKHTFYQQLQGELNLLNTHAARINSLRKELIKTDMRVRHKNKFFQRLSTAGDSVFPRRKDLIGKVSEEFLKDVDQFILNTFKDGVPQQPSFLLRDLIKDLQAMAKILTLNTQAFTATRMKLSEAWDKVKEVAKERKKIRTEQKAELRKNVEEFKEKIDSCTKAFAEGNINVEEAQQHLEAISDEMRSVRLGRDEIRYLRDELRQARAPINEKLNEETKRLEEEQKELERQRKEKYEAFKENIQQMLKNSADLDVDMLIAKRKEIKQIVQDTDYNRTEKRELELLLKEMSDLIQEKKEQALMNLSDDDQKALQQLREVLSQRIKRRQEIKEQLEVYRKEAGSLSLGFEQAMIYNEQISIEKERLEKINQGIEEIQDKIEELESKVY